MAKFEVVNRLYGEVLLPERKTAASAGYDFAVAEDTIVYPYIDLYNEMIYTESATGIITLAEVADITKLAKARPTLVPTGIKCQLEPDSYLELSVRSSSPLKYWLILANGVGIIDADYYNNPDNEGEIFFQVINLSPFPIKLQKGDVIGQGIIKHYLTTEDDEATGERLGGFGSTGV